MNPIVASQAPELGRAYLLTLMQKLHTEVEISIDNVFLQEEKVGYETIEAGRQQRIPVSMCGEMAGDPRHTRLLLGLGLTDFSMHPSAIPEIKQIIRASHLEELRTLAEQILNCSDPDQLHSLVAQITH